MFVEMDGVQRSTRACAIVASSCPRAQQGKPAARNAAAGDEDAVEDGQAAEQLADLVGPAQPRRIRSWTGSAVMSSPKKRMRPEVGGKSPVMALNNVVLPAPFEPRTARRSLAAIRMLMSASATSAPK